MSDQQSKTEAAAAIRSDVLLDGWVQDFAILHKWDEKYYLDLSIIRCWVNRDYENHEVFEAGLGGRYGRRLKRKFQTADEAKYAAQKLAEKVCKEITAALTAKPSNDALCDGGPQSVESK